jgi:hypothetical protein
MQTLKFKIKDVTQTSVGCHLVIGYKDSLNYDKKYVRSFVLSRNFAFSEDTLVGRRLAHSVPCSAISLGLTEVYKAGRQSYDFHETTEF